VFTEVEYQYLNAHALGRLASIGPDGAPQIHPVVFRVDPVDGSIEISGPLLQETQKFRNIKRDPRVSLVIDDPAPDPVRPSGHAARGLEIRGAAELSQPSQPLTSGFSTEIIRIRPALIVAWNLDRPGYHSRFVI
jgi:pyridoxamine 5'-phosphate oxidase family protein